MRLLSASAWQRMPTQPNRTKERWGASTTAAITKTHGERKHARYASGRLCRQHGMVYDVARFQTKARMTSAECCAEVYISVRATVAAISSRVRVR